MRPYILYFFTGILLALSGLFFCSGLDDSTSLGKDVINGVYPDKVSIDKHFGEFSLDSTACLATYSLPDTSDTGFGEHNVTKTTADQTSPVMVIGTRNGEEGFGFVRFFCPADADTLHRTFGSHDTLDSIKLTFTRVTVGMPARFAVYSVTNLSFALDPAPGSDGTVLLDTLAFSDSAKTDTVLVGHDSLRSAIFRACTSTVAISPGDTFSFALKNLDSDSLVRFDAAAPLLRVRTNYQDRRDTTRPKDTFRIKNYGVAGAWYAVKENRPDSLAKLTVSSYASGRTAVYAYDVRSLWKAMGDGGSSSLIKDLVSAGFVVRHPKKDTSSLYVRYFLTPEPVKNGRTLDAYFSLVSNATLKDTARALYADVRGVLQSAAQGSRPSTIYLYLRVYCDQNSTLASQYRERWQSVQWEEVPYLKAIIHED